MSDDLPAQACVVFLSCLRVCPTSLCTRHLDAIRHASTFAPSTRSNVLCRETPSTRRAQKDAGPYFKRLELVLRLAHVGLEEGERAELLDPVARIPIYRVVPFVDLDAA